MDPISLRMDGFHKRKYPIGQKSRTFSGAILEGGPARRPMLEDLMVWERVALEGK